MLDDVVLHLRRLRVSHFFVISSSFYLSVPYFVNFSDIYTAC